MAFTSSRGVYTGGVPVSSRPVGTVSSGTRIAAASVSTSGVSVVSSGVRTAPATRIAAPVASSGVRTAPATRLAAPVASSGIRASPVTTTSAPITSSRVGAPVVSAGVRPATVFSSGLSAPVASAGARTISATSAIPASTSFAAGSIPGRVINASQVPSISASSRIVSAGTPISSYPATSVGARIIQSTSGVTRVGQTLPGRIIPASEIRTAGYAGGAAYAAPVEAAPQAQADPIFDQFWPLYEEKMLAGGPESSSPAAIDAFRYNYSVLTSGASTMIPEDSLDPVPPLPTYDDICQQVQPNPDLLRETVILKLNGGLGTGMGLDKAKSLLTVTEGNSFLDLIAQQVAWMKQAYDMPDLKFMLMNSFSTSQDTLEALAKYPFLGTGADLEFVQNKAPKVTAEDFSPAECPSDPSHEWCPPGHGDLYPALLGSGTLDTLLQQGYRYMFVSNSDNLGATMDLTILSYFAATGAPFMMECAARTEADKKGGHLAISRETGGLTLRESAQCPKEDEKAFQDTEKYAYFNTNNLWVDLVQLAEAFNAFGGFLPLPVMKNDKTVDPRDKKSTKVVQLETAMGAAISCFQGATALLIPRERFAPVKKCDDLIALRSDAYVLTEDFRIVLAAERQGVPPTVKLDDKYKFADALEKLIPNGPPSLIACTKLKVEGKLEFEQGVVVVGDVTFKTKDDDHHKIPAGVYENGTFEF